MLRYEQIEVSITDATEQRLERTRLSVLLCKLRGRAARAQRYQF